MVAVARQQQELNVRPRQWAPKRLLGFAAPTGISDPSLARRQEECCRDRDGGESKESSEDTLCRREDGGGPGSTVGNKIEMESKMEVMRKNIKGLFLVDQNCLKKFTIPKKPPDKDFLTECPANKRDYSEIKQRLNENCLDIQCHLESLWQFHKIEMVHNKDLEEEFIAKRTELREEGKQDKELSSFLVVSRDEVPQICQHGLCTTGHSINIMKELGNPQLGVYLFRYVDIALNYASKHSFPVENIIIFRVLLGKVKKVQPPKSQKKIVLDPTPNFDCHMSRIHPSLKDSLEDQATGSLVYFYEYNEDSKPVDKPRQCLPYAVIHVKSVNQKGGADSFLTSLKCRLKRLPKHTGGVIPLENCTRVTRIEEDEPCPLEEKIDVSHNKKKKVAASLMTTIKIDEKEVNRNMRNNGKCNSSEGEGPHFGCGPGKTSPTFPSTKQARRSARKFYLQELSPPARRGRYHPVDVRRKAEERNAVVVGVRHYTVPEKEGGRPGLSRAVWRRAVGHLPVARRPGFAAERSLASKLSWRQAAGRHGGQELYQGVGPMDRAAQRVQAAEREPSSDPLREG
ncbi:testis-expressed sequence 15 protein [Crotalus adamanteus]|uniref:Testis-expressed sequence 15 protein n=1 Tax=Crotalus adamanteus TaxID=8729 RepID=A0AAW1C263_CROAD